MYVVMAEASFGESTVVVQALREAGQYVSTCHEWSGVCQALRPGRRCPLDYERPVDLMVDVRGREPELTAREYGVVCALRERVPVVVVGVDPMVPPRVPDGLESWVTVESLDSVVAACRATASVGCPPSHRPLPVEVFSD
jgi:hypothetical protein